MEGQLGLKTHPGTAPKGNRCCNLRKKIPESHPRRTQEDESVGEKDHGAGKGGDVSLF